MKTVGEILKLSTQFLQEKGIDKPRRQAEELLSHILKLPRIELYLQFDRPLHSKELDSLRSSLKLRAQRKPWQYIVGEVEFLNCFIEVTPNVLIPRLETEILADRVIKALPPAPLTVWDVCSGSGCLGIAIKKKRPDCHVTLSDLSEKALEVAKKNAARNEVEVNIRQGDLLAPFQGLKADVVVCNPPYISLSDYGSLEPEVREWEPKMALVGGVTGREFYERLAKELPSFLNRQAKVYLEIGAGMGDAVKNLFHSSEWKSVNVLQDWSSNDRFLEIEYLLV